MKKVLFAVLTVLGLSGLLVTGGTFLTLSFQPSYSSPEEQSDDDQQEEPAGDEPVDGSEPETPSEDLPISDEQEETTATQGPADPAPEREVCVTNANGQKFCYKELKPDEVCLKPMNAEDPPICPPPKPEGITNESTLENTSPINLEGDPIPANCYKDKKTGKLICD